MSAIANCPALLVSVRNVVEARAAVSGGCDILDVKEPTRGPLGMADVETIGDIAQSRERSAESRRRGDTSCFPPLSVALGEEPDWLGDRRMPCLPAGVAFAKLAFAGCRGIRDWASRWLEVRKQFEHASRFALNGQASGLLQWVAVAYADWKAANAPHPQEIIEAAAETGCSGLLIDTFRKDGRTLLDSLPLSQLRRLTRHVRSSEMMLALAGSLHSNLLPTLVALEPDVLGIRTAACRGGRRFAAVSAPKVRNFRVAMTAAFGPASAARSIGSESHASHPRPVQRPNVSPLSETGNG